MNTKIEESLKAAKAAREEMSYDDDLLLTNLIFGAGVLFGSGFPGASEAVLEATRRVFPGAEVPKIGDPS